MTKAYEDIMKVSTQRPMCRRAMSIRNLRYKPACRRQKAPSKVEQLIAQAREAAVNAHRIRMGGAENAGDS